ncbi:MAG: ribosome small subunit-dependent GTPase A [Erysipelotrichaceae bacterium]|nr:ribosome small subunit-dependent GTPase A [Erysipelotrichaceae bacterium]
MTGLIIKIVSNQYTVHTEDGKDVVAVAMGKLRLGSKPLVGDRVEYELIDDRYAIQKILPRTNYLVRPAIANVDQAMIVMSAVEPDFSPRLVDKLIFLISYRFIEPVLVITKMDLVKEDSRIYEYIEDYRNSGYTVITVGADSDVEYVREALRGRITVLTGQSGVGKSTLLNRLDEAFATATQEISRARGRGKHTTRHTQLYEVGEGLIADTPGFSSLDFSRIDALTLAGRIHDFQNAGECRFKDCKHINEPDCRVKKKVESGEISRIRYLNYLDTVKLCNQKEDWE